MNSPHRQIARVAVRHGLRTRGGRSSLSKSPAHVVPDDSPSRRGKTHLAQSGRFAIEKQHLRAAGREVRRSFLVVWCGAVRCRCGGLC